MLDDHTYLVSELGRDISATLDREFGDVWISGTIRGLSRKRNHVYFDLVEQADDPGQPAKAQLSIALFSTNKNLVNKLLKRANIGRIHDGMQVRIRGVVDFYPPTGRISVRMTSIDPTFTLAKLVDERDRVLKLLETEGLLGRNEVLEFPPMPLRVGLVTAEGSAAYHDFMNELGQTGFAWRVTLIDSRVQGGEAPRLVSAAIRTLDRRGVDVIAIVRGGGSKGDLAAFDHELVARAIATASVPVITGIGHEIDTSIADAVAHTAYKTPTSCAAGLADHARLFDAMLLNRWFAVQQRSQQLLDVAEFKLNRRAETAAILVRSTLDNHQATLDQAVARIGRSAATATRTATTRLLVQQQRLVREAPRQLANASHTVDTLAMQVRGHDPARALARGWSITTTADGEIVRSTSQLTAGAEIRTRLGDGTVHSTVQSTSADKPT